MTLAIAFQIVSTLVIGVYIAIKFAAEFTARNHDRKEKFLLAAWKIDAQSTEVDNELKERLLHVLYKHRTGLSATRRQREIYDLAIEKADGSLSYTQLANNIDRITIENGKLTMASPSYKHFWPIFFTLFALVNFAMYIYRPTILELTLLVAYAGIAYASWQQVHAASRLEKILEKQ